MGFVGAGGLGPADGPVDEDAQRRRGLTILIVFLLLVLLADALSGALRRLLA